MVRNDEPDTTDSTINEIEAILKGGGDSSVGVLEPSFLLQSIGGLTRKLPLCVSQDLDAHSVVRLMIEKSWLGFAS